jgi:hypothetical protein
LQDVPSSLLSLFSLTLAHEKDKASTLFCRWKRQVFVLYFFKKEEERGGEMGVFQQADYY